MKKQEMSEETALARIDAVQTAIEAADLETLAKSIRLLDAANRHAKAKKWLEVARETDIWAIDARREAGKMLSVMEKNPGTRTVGQIEGEPRGGAVLEPPRDIPRLQDLGIGKKESSAWQRLATIDDDEWEVFKVKARSGEFSGADVSRAFSETFGGYLSSMSEEFYTHPEYIAAVRGVMGGIDTDPCSTEKANQVVGATVYFSEEQDGLKQEWNGRVFMNPPYGEKCEAFVSKLLEEIELGRVKEAIVLVFSKTETAWFQSQFPASVCFPRGRKQTVRSDGSPATPTHGSAFIYFGKNAKRFRDTFSKFGIVGDLQ